MIGTAKGGGLISRAVREALGTMVSPQICEQLITRSLAALGLSTIPESGTVIGEWLEAGLRPEVETVVGTDAADVVMAQLGPIAAYAAISQPKQPGKSSLQAPPPPAKAHASLPPLAFTQFDSDEPDRATDLRMNPAETDWTAFTAAGPPTSKPRDVLFDSSPPTGRPSPQMFDSSPPTGRPSPQMFDSSPPTGRPAPRLFDSSPDMAVMTLPPARPISDANARPTNARPANDVALYTARPQAQDGEKIVSEAPAILPSVLAATSDMGDFETLRRYLGGSAAVVHIPDLVGLLDALDEPGLLEPIVVIDCQRPTVHTTSVSALGEDLPRGTTVVLWGADENTWQQIDRDRSPTCRWVRCSREASTSDVGSLCSMLIG